MSRPSSPATGRRRFILVGDHLGFRQMLRVFLPPSLVTECADGLAALACYAIGQADWVQMDMEMPGMDGLSTARELKRRSPEARIIFVSLHAEEEFRSAARALGTCGFFHKAHLEELRATIEAAPDEFESP